MHILYTRNPLITIRINKVKWITAHNCGKPTWHSFSPSLMLRRENVGPWHCLTKCALGNKLLNPNCWSWYHLSREELPHTSYCIHILQKVCCSIFFYGPPCKRTSYYYHYHYRVPKCDVINFFFFAFQHFHDHILVERDEKPSHTKFDMNWFMVARDMATWIPN